MEKENLKALIRGIDLTAYQRGLALNEFKQMESQLQSLQEERDRLREAVKVGHKAIILACDNATHDEFTEDELGELHKAEKTLQQALQEERDRLREASIGNFTYAELWRMAQKYNADDFVQALQQALQSEE